MVLFDDSLAGDEHEHVAGGVHPTGETSYHSYPLNILHLWLYSWSLWLTLGAVGTNSNPNQL